MDTGLIVMIQQQIAILANDNYNGTPEFQPEWEWVEHLLKQARQARLQVYFKDNLKVRPLEVPWE